MRTLLLMTLLALPLSVATAASPEYSLVRVHLDDPAAMAYLQAHPQFDVVQVKPGVFAEVVANAADLAALRGSGLRLEVVYQDLVAYYADRMTSRDGGNFGLWHTYSENTAVVDSLRMLYPQVVSAKWSLGQTAQLRNIWCFRLSDNPDVDENEPEILIDGMHHAREIMASEFTIMFATYLASRYGTDPVVTWLLDNRELYVVPIVNPDGVVYNEQTDPAGGGMWRKNRRANTGGSYGVDLNRNYPFHWGEEGSSPTPSDETYRGPSAGSEPETQAMMSFINSHQFVTHQSIHTYGNYTLHPWGYTATPCPDDALFTAMSQVMTQDNGYVYGPAPDVLYTTSGSTTDWAYGATNHPEILSFSNEIGGGSDGFWPAESRRGALFQENLWPHLYLMMSAAPFVEVVNPVAVDAGGGLLQPGEAGFLDVTVVNRAALQPVGSVSLTFTCDDPYLQLDAAQRTIASVPAMGSSTLASDIPLTIDAACPDGHLVSLMVTADWGQGGLAYPLAFRVGNSSTLFQDSFSSGLGNWTLAGGWGLTATAHTAPYALTDSPSGDYNYNASAKATLNGSYYAARLTFWHRYGIEDGWDYGHVQVAANGGAWNTVASYTGLLNSWQQIAIDLGAYAGQSLRLRFLLESDGYINEDGWYIDDVVLTSAGGTNLTPPPPALVGPDDGASVGPSPLLTVANSADPDGPGPVTYGFRVYGDAALTQLVASANGVAEGVGQTTWVPANLAGDTYWWRAYAADAVEWGDLGTTRSFIVTTTPVDDIVIAGPRLAVLGTGGGSARLQLSLASAADVQVKIYNARGQLVRDLFSGRVDAGSRVLVWDGRDVRGRATASGVYFVRAATGNDTLTGRVMIVR